MFKKIGALIVTILGALLLVYSASRSLDFIMLTLPPDRQILAYFGLAALDGGLIAWILSYLYGSRGGWQRAISLLMILVDMVGAVGMFTLDTLYQTGTSGMTAALTPSEIQTAVLALSGVIALNIAATIFHHLTDPDKLKEQAEEEAFAKVEDATIRQISSNAEQLAAEVAPMLAADWMQNSRARYLANLGSGRIPALDVTARDIPALPAAAKKTANNVNLSTLWAGLPWMTTKTGNGHKLQLDTVTPGEVQAPAPFGGNGHNGQLNQPQQ